MKKRKFSLILNISVLCMCVVAIAIGVYSAKNASLDVSGTIGFNAHNCDVDIQTIMYGDSVATDSPTAEATPTGVPRSKAQAKQFDTISVKGNNKTLDLETIYFCDMTESGKINPITLNFVITNKSLFYVDLTVDRNCINNNRIFIYAPNNGETLAPNGQTGSSITLTVEFQLQRDASNNYSNLDSAISLSSIPLLNFTKSQAPAYLATTWQDKIKNVFTSGYDSDCSVSFVREINDTILDGFAKNGETYQTVSVGAVNGTGIDGNLTTDVSDVVAYCKLTENSYISDIIIYSSARIYAPQNCNRFFADEKKFESIDFSNFDTSIVTNMSGMFSGYFGLELLNLSNFDTSRVTDMNNMFYDCSGGPDSLDVSNFNTSIVTNMGNMFAKCMFLENLDVSNFDTSSVNYMNGMFYDCEGLTSLDVSNFDTSKVTNMSGMFYNCVELTNLDLSNFNTNKVEDMFQMFRDSAKLTTIYVNSNKWSTANVTSSGNMFYNCKSLVGGAGTIFTSSQTDKTYARVDGGTSNPGYLTLKNN